MTKTVPGPTGAARPARPDLPDDSSGERLPLVFISIVLVEVIAIAGLYWFGVYFA